MESRGGLGFWSVNVDADRRFLRFPPSFPCAAVERTCTDGEIKKAYRKVSGSRSAGSKEGGREGELES